ncbi:MAG: serine/threonine protein kinase [Deltaproteobacteria bacterium]|nr:serine/threonine protein kinase [Deltaproteobacteria bacterium]
MAVKPGDILGGKYRIDALIGRGGMGHVFAATDLGGTPGDDRAPVAIKVVSRVTFDETLLARLHREAEAAARIRSDYVPHVLEVSDTDDKEMFMVMERLVGEPLSQRMRDKGFLPWPEVAQIGQDVLRGLIDAHTAGVVHRDIKPSNVFLAKKGDRERAMVLDFGVCKTDAVDTERLTGTGEAIGTVAYMAPEQIRGASKVDDRADLYSFGVVVYEMLSGRLPHDGPSQMAILASKLENTPPRLRDATRAMIPEGLDELVARVLARDPAARFASAQELLKAWRKLGAAEIGASRPSLPDSHSTDDLHDAPTRHSGQMGDPDLAPTQLGLADMPVPLEAHPTQTALSAPGISLRKGGPGRFAMILAGCALVAGVVGMVAAFAKGPDVAAGSASNAASTGAALAAPPAAPPSDPRVAPSDAPTPPASAPSAIELGDVPPAPETSVAAAPRKPPPAKPKGAPKTGAAPAKSSAPHITSQPRY